MPGDHFLHQTWLQTSLLAYANVILGLELTEIWGVAYSVADKERREAIRTARPDAKIVGIRANYGDAHANVQVLQRYLAADMLLEADAETALPHLIAEIERRLTRDIRGTVAGRRLALVEAHRAMRARDALVAANGWDASPISTARLSMKLWGQIRKLD